MDHDGCLDMTVYSSIFHTLTHMQVY